MVTTEKEWINRATVAGMIRKDLKREFPGIKFTVRSRSYSGGGSINIGWTDGPTTNRVQGVTGRYADRGFDGSIDLQYYINHARLADGTIVQIHSSGTQGSMGAVPGFREELPPGAVEVNLNTGYVSCNRDFSEAFKASVQHLIPTNIDGYDRERWEWRVMNETEA